MISAILKHLVQHSGIRGHHRLQYLLNYQDYQAIQSLIQTYNIIKHSQEKLHSS